MAQGKKTGLDSVINAEIYNQVNEEPARNKEDQIDIVRATVDITKEAARAISITAQEAVREGARFMGVIGTRGELLDPFKHIDAPVWTEAEIPQHMIDTSYEFCEELTRREAGNFYHSFKYLGAIARVGRHSSDRESGRCCVAWRHRDRRDDLQFHLLGFWVFANGDHRPHCTGSGPRALAQRSRNLIPCRPAGSLDWRIPHPHTIIYR